jgi:hypothetical protein
MGTLDLSHWTQQQLTILLLATFCGILLVIALLLIYIRKTRPVPPSGESASDDESDLGKPPDILLRRKNWTGRLEVKVNDVPHRRMREIQDRAARRAVRMAAIDLLAFADLNAPGPLQGAPGAAQQPPDKELARHALLAQLEQGDRQTASRGNWLDAFGLGAAGKQAAEKSKDFVAEIEDILQRRVKEQGVKSEVHLRTDAEGVVRVEVDGVLFDDASDIPELSVREVLRAAVGEWEARH